jgi:hypothetical protein
MVKHVKYAELHSALKAWHRDAQDVLSNRSPRLRMRRRTTEVGDGRLGWVEELRLDYRAIVALAFQSLMELPSTADVVAVIKGDLALAEAVIDPAIASIAGPDWPADRREWVRARDVFARILQPLAEEHWRATDSLEPNEEAFGRLYGLLEQALADPQGITVRYVQQFWNLRLDLPAIELRPGVLFRQATAKEWDRTMEQAEPPEFSGNLWNQHSLGAVLEVTNRLGDFPPDGAPDFMLACGRLARTAELGLRLARPEWVDLKSAEAYAENPFAPWLAVPKSIGWPATELPGRGYFADHYVLTPAIVDELRSTWRQLDAALDDPNLRIPTSRLAYTYERGDEADRLVDYWIALEALFATDGTQELKYRASLRIARFVGSSPDERRRLFGEMKTSYDLRSHLVHGGDSNSKKCRRLPEVVDQTGATLRRALRLCLERGQPPPLPDIDAGLLA